MLPDGIALQGRQMANVNYRIVNSLQLTKLCRSNPCDFTAQVLLTDKYEQLHTECIEWLILNSN